MIAGSKGDSPVSEENWERFKKEVFPKALAMAQHEDQMNRWPWWARLGHFLFVSWRCPCCKMMREK
jgi:hypothetical protein